MDSYIRSPILKSKFKNQSILIDDNNQSTFSDDESVHESKLVSNVNIVHNESKLVSNINSKLISNTNSKLVSKNVCEKSNCEKNECIDCVDDKYLKELIKKLLNSDDFRGPAGKCGAPGKTGNQGERGLNGAPGRPGPPGPNGIQGPIGPSGGPVGPQGKQGDIGLSGPIGPQGLIGPRGPEGRQGQPGSMGPQGQLGDQGPEGPQGPAGIRGAPGAIGLQGNTGEKGEQGMTGKVANDFSEFLIKLSNVEIVNEDEITLSSAYGILPSNSPGGYAPMYSTNPYNQIQAITISTNSNRTQVKFNLFEQMGTINTIYLTTSGPNSPIMFSPLNATQNGNSVYYEFGNQSLYDSYVSSGSVWTMKIMWN